MKEREPGSRRVFVVTGANRGIGREICRQLAVQSEGGIVMLTARDPAEGKSVCEAMRAKGLTNLGFHPLNVSIPESIALFARYVKEHLGGIDVLVNNAGHASRGPLLNEEVARATLAVNFYGARDTTIGLRPHIHGGGRIINVSSGMGDLDAAYSEARRRAMLDPDLTMRELEQLVEEFVEDVAVQRVSRRGWPTNAYGVSKAALNALTRIWARDWTSSHIMVNSVCPGWVRTRMGGMGATHGVKKGAETPVWLALAIREEIKATGSLFRNKQLVSW